MRECCEADVCVVGGDIPELDPLAFIPSRALGDIAHNGTKRTRITSDDSSTGATETSELRVLPYNSSTKASRMMDETTKEAQQTQIDSSWT